jgi:hypothetical protein
VVRDLGRAEHLRHGNETHRDAGGHGAWDPLPGGTPMDERAAGGLANEEEAHAPTARGVQKGYARYGQDHEDAVWVVVPTRSGYVSQAGARIWVRVHVPGQGQEAQRLYAETGADAQDRQGNREDLQATS